MKSRKFREGEKTLNERIDAIESVLGITKDMAGKKMHLLLDTIVAQGDQIGQMHQQTNIMAGIIQMRDGFITETGQQEAFTRWANEKQAAKAGEGIKKAAAEETAKDPALEQKEPTPPTPAAQATTDEAAGQPGTREVKETDGMIKAEDKKPKQVVTEDKTQDAVTAINDSKKEIVNDG